MRWRQIAFLTVGMLAVYFWVSIVTAQTPAHLPAMPPTATTMPVQPEVPGDLTREDLLKIIARLEGIRGEIKTVEGLGRIKAYVDNADQQIRNDIMDAVDDREDEQSLRDRIQDEARRALKLWALEKFLERRVHVPEIIPAPQPIVQYEPQPQYIPQPQYVPQPRSGCSQRRLAVTVGVTARRSFFGNKVILKPTLSLQ